MLKFSLLEDDELCEVVDLFISGLLPHKGFDSSKFSDILSTLYKYVHLDEFQMEYRLLLEALTSMNRLKSSFKDYVPKLEFAALERLLEASIMDAVVREELGVQEWMKYEGMNTNLQIQAVKEEVCQRLCERTLTLYRRCFDLSVESGEVLNHEPELRAAFIAHVGVQCINVQSEIMRHEARVGRKRYCGFQDWLAYTKSFTAEVDNRLREAEGERVLTLDSLDGSYALLHEIQGLLVPITNYGIPEIDAFTPIMRHRLVVIVGRENIGKTKFAIDQTGNVLLEGGKVVYMCGESQKASVFAAVVINYIYKRYGIVVRTDHLTAPEACPEEVRKIIGMSVDEISRGGKLTLCDAFNYATYYDELVDLHEKLQFDVVVVDHSCALEGSVGDGSLKAKVDRLAEDSRRFKKAFPCCVMITSHPSALSKETAKRGKMTEDSPTKGSQNLSTEADEVFYLRDNDTLRKQGLLMLENTKRRDAGVIMEPIILRKRFEVSVLEYSEAIQGREAAMTLRREEALQIIEEECGADDDVYSI